MTTSQDSEPLISSLRVQDRGEFQPPGLGREEVVIATTTAGERHVLAAGADSSIEFLCATDHAEEARQSGGFDLQDDAAAIQLTTALKEGDESATCEACKETLESLFGVERVETIRVKQRRRGTYGHTLWTEAGLGFTSVPENLSVYGIVEDSQRLDITIENPTEEAIEFEVTADLPADVHWRTSAADDFSASDPEFAETVEANRRRPYRLDLVYVGDTRKFEPATVTLRVGDEEWTHTHFVDCRL